MSTSEKINPFMILPPLFRFIMEITAWLWLFIAVFSIDLFYIIFLCISICSLAFMNFPGDKAKDGPIPVPGFVRIFNELVFAGLFGIISAWILFGQIGLVLQSSLIVIVVIFDYKRYLWMLGYYEIPPIYVTYFKSYSQKT